MNRNGFKRAVVLGLAASALMLAGGCRQERGRPQGPQYVPSQQDQGTGGTGGAGQQPVDVNPLPNQEGFRTVPKQETLPNGIGNDSQREQGR